MAQSYYIGDESVRGTIIGGEREEKRYQFWTYDDPPLQITGSKWFKTDEEAIAWFEDNYTETLKREREQHGGVEMRTWD
jgi:hypothetical protein